MSKGGQQTTETRLPKSIERAAKDNLRLAQEIGSIPYAPYAGPMVAAFTPMQEASFANTNSAANAFGMNAAPSALAGIPAPENVGGFRGYSTMPLYNEAMSRVDPQVLEMYNALFGPEALARRRAQSEGSTSGKGGSGGKGGQRTELTAEEMAKYQANKAYFG